MLIIAPGQKANGGNVAMPFRASKNNCLLALGPWKFVRDMDILSH